MSQMSRSTSVVNESMAFEKLRARLTFLVRITFENPDKNSDMRQ